MPTGRRRTQVAIVGAGPAGLLLGQLLGRAGIDHLIVERQSAAHVRGRIRAGVLEQTTVDLLDAAGVGARLHREGLVHDGFALCVDGVRHRIDLAGLTGGKHVTVYGQTELTRDLMEARTAAGWPTLYEAEDVRIDGFLDDGGPARVSVGGHAGGGAEGIDCDFIAGCDGSHGVCRASVPPAAITVHERSLPVAWLGLLADVPPVAPELLYVHHDRGFALASMRSPTRSRYYIQCAADDRAERWSDAAFWEELQRRLDPAAAAALVTGPALEKSIAPLRSVVAEPMRFGRLFLAGDAAHIVPPTGAKGLNLAAADVRVLAGALIAWYAERDGAGLDAYSERCLRRVWKASRFAWWFSGLMHDLGGDAMRRRLQRAELDDLVGSRAAMTVLAENYVGLPFED